MCRAARDWAKRQPHEYALLYGSPVPGYRAPADTIDPAAGIPLTLFGPLRDGWRAGSVADRDGVPVTGELSRQLQGLADQLAPDVPPAVIGAAISAWTRLFGLISFELFGHLVGSVDPADAFFEHEIAVMAGQLGLPAGKPAS